MVKKIMIGIVGCGAIGTSLAKAIVNNFTKQATLASLYDINEDKALGLAKKLRINASILSPSLDYLIERADLVIEAAAASSCLSIAKRVLGKGRDIIIMSVGGIVAHINELRNLAIKKRARVYIPSGAICGVDGLKGTSQGKIKKIILTTRKNPKSFKNIDYIKQRKIKLDKIKKDTILFSGNAGRAIKFFPQNINVAATLGIAGIGESRTQVRIIASPKIKRNIHEILIESDAGRISTRVENLVHPENPKTSFLAVLSAVATLRQILEPIKIGT